MNVPLDFDSMTADEFATWLSGNVASQPSQIPIFTSITLNFVDDFRREVVAFVLANTILRAFIREAGHAVLNGRRTFGHWMEAVNHIRFKKPQVYNAEMLAVLTAMVNGPKRIDVKGN